MNTTYSITSKFQITVPKEIRDKLGITSRDKIRFKTENDQLIIIEKVPSMKEVADSIAADLKKRNIGQATDDDIKNARSSFYKRDLKWQ